MIFRTKEFLGKDNIVYFLVSKRFYLSCVHFSIQIDTLCFLCENDRYIKVLSCDTGNTDTGCFNCKDFGNWTVREAAFELFADFIDEKGVELIGVEAAGLGIETGKHASAMALGEPGVLHGMKSYLLQDTDGNIQLAHSISAGLDYPGVGPEHAYLRDSGRAQYVAITDVEAMDALMELCKLEGIIPAIESAHAVAYAFKKAKEMTMEQSMIVCLSGRGDKDINTIASYLAGEGYLN